MTHLYARQPLCDTAVFCINVTSVLSSLCVPSLQEDSSDLKCQLHFAKEESALMCKKLTKLVKDSEAMKESVLRSHCWQCAFLRSYMQDKTFRMMEFLYSKNAICEVLLTSKCQQNNTKNMYKMIFDIVFIFNWAQCHNTGSSRLSPVTWLDVTGSFQTKFRGIKCRLARN